MINLIYKGIVFDDYTENTDPDLTKYWSQVCKEHIKGLEGESDEIGYGICGVEGCNNFSEHYVDFKEEEVEINNG